MSGEFDVNAVMADVTTQLVKDSLASVLQKLTRAAKTAYGKMLTDFEEHMLSVYQRVATVKIITSRDQPVSFSSVYTSSGFSCGDRRYSDEELIALIISGRRCIISGNGGAGKTFFTRKVWLEIFRKKGDKIPLLVELRKLNSLSSYDVVSFIRASAFGNTEFDEATFAHFCSQGAFVFILDGFDEVIREKREELESQILALSKKFPSCGLVVSGRPDSRFDAWGEFSTFKAAPFGYDQFRSLIGKVPFDSETKRAFLKIATESFFAEHESFLSNPLLSLMMLLTFRDNAEIPGRLSTFYENCFATLYAQHDALKESFNRKKTLDQLRFKRLFSAFSLVSYLASKPSFDGAEFISTIEKAVSITGIAESVENISHDFLESVNLLVKEGQTYYFIHRSFQEFFAAYCVCNVISARQQGDVLTKFAKRRFDSSLRLTYELHPRLVEDSLLMPLYRELNKASRLPRKAARGARFNAVNRTGLALTIGFVFRRVSPGSPSAGRSMSYRFKWDEQYEVLSNAVSVIGSSPNGERQRLLGGSLDMIVIDAMHTKIFSVPTSILDQPDDLRVEVELSFTADDIEIEMSADSNFEAYLEEIGPSLRDYLLSCAVNIERRIVENNKYIVQCADLMLSNRGPYDDVLGEVIL